MTKILITGAAGFIGFHLIRALAAKDGLDLTGLDNVNDYYDPALKRARLKILKTQKGFEFIEADMTDRQKMTDIFTTKRFDIVINLAAQAGVRYSLENPHAYVDSNIDGFLNILEGCRHTAVKHLIFASSSSVYGANKTVPFSTDHNVDHPVSLYAATKKAGELMAHTYAHLYGIPCTGLRFFTVYGPWGRPDMAYFKFTRNILSGQPIEIFNHGDMRRDFTYIDDIIEAMVRLIDHIPEAASDNFNTTLSPARSSAPYRLYNIGNNNPENLMDFVEILEELIGKKAEKTMLPMQSGDVYETYADCEDLEQAIGFKPYTPLRQGLSEFLNWYMDYYEISKAA